MTNHIKVKLNANLKNYKAGNIININPSDRYWARRIKDSKIDNCLEIVKKEKNAKKNKEKKSIIEE